jgi:hypothetical protein
MKNLLLLFAATLFITTVKADPWDNLTQAQAEEVVEHLNENPFILDYCDCCDGDATYLLKVVKSEIVTCDWDADYKSVKVTATKIGQLERGSTGPVSAYRVKGMDEETTYTIYMNYTFVYSACGNWAVPFFKEVEYNNYGEHVCAGATRFPNPEDNKEITDEEYIKWFEKTGMK